MIRKLPPPPLPSAPLSDDEEAIDDQAAAVAQISLAWRDALDWAKRGDRRSLAALLRGECSFDDDKDIRTFLADVLESKEKRPRGKPARRPDRTWGYDALGNTGMINAHDKRTLEIRKWVKDNRSTFKNVDDVYKAAADKFNVHRTTVEVADRRSAKAWKR